MGCCISSTSVETNPITGETKTKHKMGGAFPGNRRQPGNTYTPPASQFSNGQATAHFVSYGGGNALVLQNPNGAPSRPQTGAMVATAKPPEYISVTLPAGVEAGQTIRVAAPDGRLNEIVVPPGMGPGSTFTVEFASPDDTADYKPSYSSSSNNNYAGTGSSSSNNYGSSSNNYASSSSTPVTATATTLPPPQVGNDEDDGFASGFGRDLPTARPVYR